MQKEQPADWLPVWFIRDLEGEDLLTAHGTVGRFVTSDAHILAEARSRMRRDAAREWLSEAKTMGMSVDEMIEYIKEESEK